MKNLLFLSMVLVLILIPTLSFADMSAPSYVVYSGYVSNPNGASYYKSTNEEAEIAGTIPFKTKIICHYNYGDSKFAFVLEGENFSYESDSTKFIDKYNVTIDDLTKYELGEKQNARTFENTIIYNLPTDATEGKVLGMIPSETDITVQPYRVNEEETGLWNGWTEWYYTSYNDVNGWIKIDNFGFLNKEITYYTDKNLLTKDGSFVPTLTTINEYYGFGGGLFSKAMFYYEDELVEADIEYDFANEINNEDLSSYTYEVLFEGMPLYEQANVKSKKAVDSIPVGTTLVGEYIVWGHAFKTWLGVRYEGSILWLYIGNMDSYRNKTTAEIQFENNKKTLAEAKEKNWDWIDDLNYPTDIAGVKRYYEFLLEDGRTYSEDAIEESDATKKIGDKKKGSLEELAKELEEISKVEDAVGITTETNSNAALGAATVAGLIVTVIVLLVVLIVTIVVIIILVNKNKKQG